MKCLIAFLATASLGLPLSLLEDKSKTDWLPFHETVHDVLLQLGCLAQDKETNKLWRRLGWPTLHSVRLLWYAGRLRPGHILHFLTLALQSLFSNTHICHINQSSRTHMHCVNISMLPRMFQINLQHKVEVCLRLTVRDCTRKMNVQPKSARCLSCVIRLELDKIHK